MEHRRLPPGLSRRLHSGGQAARQPYFCAVEANGECRAEGKAQEEAVARVLESLAGAPVLGGEARWEALWIVRSSAVRYQVVTPVGMVPLPEVARGVLTTG